MHLLRSISRQVVAVVVKFGLVTRHQTGFSSERTTKRNGWKNGWVPRLAHERSLRFSFKEVKKWRDLFLILLARVCPSRSVIVECRKATVVCVHRASYEYPPPPNTHTLNPFLLHNHLECLYAKYVCVSYHVQSNECKKVTALCGVVPLQSDAVSSDWPRVESLRRLKREGC